MNILSIRCGVVAALFYLSIFNLSFGDLLKIETNTSLKAVYLIEEPDNAIIQVNLVVLAGEVDFDGPQGLAHYLEHLMFWHADSVSDGPYHGRGGNAWINGIITNYHNTGNKDELADLFGFAARLLTKPDLKRKFMIEERDVVAREYDLRVSENPDRKAYSTLMKMLFGANPAGRSTIGTPKSINALTIEQAIGFHKKYYVPANMVLLVSGNISPKEVRKRVEEAFGGVAPGESNPKLWFHSPVRAELKELIEVTDSNAAFHSYKFAALTDWQGSGDPLSDWYTIQFVKMLQRSSLPGGLSKPLRSDNFVVSGYDFFLRKMIDGQIMFGLQANPDDGVSFAEVDAAVTDAMASTAKLGVPAKTVDRLRKRWLQVAERRKDEADYIRNRFFEHLTAGLDPNSIQQHRRGIENIEKVQVDSLLKALAIPHRRVEYHLKKKED